MLNVNPQNYAELLHAHIKTEIKKITVPTLQRKVAIFPDLNKLLRFFDLTTAQFLPRHIQNVVNVCNGLLESIAHEEATHTLSADLIEIKKTIVSISDKATQFNDALVNAVKNKDLSEEVYPVTTARRASTVISEGNLEKR